MLLQGHELRRRQPQQPEALVQGLAEDPRQVIGRVACDGSPAGLKARRMRLIAANGILVSVPAALFLAMKAQAGELDLAFYTVQAVALLAGAVNLAVLVASARPGLRLIGRIRRP